MAWNRQSEESEANASGSLRQGRKPSPVVRYAIVGAMSIAGVALAIWALRIPSTEKAGSDEGNAVVTQVVAKAKSEVEPKAQVPVPPVKRIRHKHIWKPKTIPDKTANLKPPAIVTEQRLRFRKACEKFFGKQLFTQPSDNIISGIISARPGTTFLPIEIGEQFEKDFKESLKHPIELKDDDTPDERAIKEDMIDARNYLEEIMKNGESVAEAVRTAREEIDKVTEYRSKLNDNLMLLLQGGSEQDVAQYLEESNKLLEEYDAIPLHISKFGWKRLRERVEREARGEPRQVPKL